MSKYVHRGAFVEAEQNNDGSYTISGVSRMSEKQFKEEFIAFPTVIKAQWNFIFNQKLTDDIYFGTIPSGWENSYETGFQCSNCGHGADLTIHEEPYNSNLKRDCYYMDDDRENYCANCGAQMMNKYEKYEEWKARAND